MAPASLATTAGARAPAAPRPAWRDLWRWALAALVVAAAAIGGAWAFELVGGFVPCALCLDQRTPYYVALPLLVVAMVLAPRWLPGGRLLALAAGAALFWSAGLGAHQAGAEWGFWAGPADCGGADAAVRDASSLLAEIGRTRLVSCTEAAARFLGLSFAGWNVLAAGAAGALALAGAVLARPAGRRR